LRLRIRACAARPATAKCGGEKPHKGRSPTAVFGSLAALRRRTVTVC